MLAIVGQSGGQRSKNNEGQKIGTKLDALLSRYKMMCAAKRSARLGGSAASLEGARRRPSGGRRAADEGGASIRGVDAYASRTVAERIHMRL